MNKSKLVAACLLAGAAVGCTDQSPTTAPNLDVAGEAPTSATGHDRMAVLPRFSLKLTASGSFKPGTPITLHARAEGIRASRSVEFRIFLPEAELARARGGTAYDGRFEGEVPTVARWRGGMGRGQVSERTARTSVLAPGYYQAVLSAQASSDEPALSGGDPVVSSATRSVWLLVTEQGGRVTEEFDPTAIPTGYAVESGPFHAAPASMAPSASLTMEDEEQTPQPPPSGGTGTSTRRYRLAYVHEVTGVLLPVANAAVSADFQVRFTDAYGYVTIPCPATNIVASLANTRVSVDATRSIASACGSPQADGEAALVLFSSPFAVFAHVFQTMNTVALRAEAFFGRARDQVAVHITVFDQQAFYSRGDGPTSEYIHLPVSFGGQTSIWSSFGTFTMAHEYGHAFQNHALGGLSDSGDGCGEHSFSSLESIGCAWNEGFADYFSVALMPYEGGFYDDISEGRPMSYARSVGIYDGSRVEGAVAAFLLHTTGADGFPPAPPAANGQYLGLLVKTCTGQVSIAFLHAWSVEPIVMCMERQVDPWVRQNYFRSDLPITSQQSSAVPPAAWTTAAVRAAWLRDLYGTV